MYSARANRLSVRANRLLFRAKRLRAKRLSGETTGYQINTDIHFAAEHITEVHQQARLMSPTTTPDIQNDHSLVREDSENAPSENESKSESEYAQLARSTLTRC